MADAREIMRSFDEFVDEGCSASIDGWDFSRFGSRLRTAQPPWDYAALAGAVSAGASSLLDMGTGGGEWLAAFGPQPARTVATEGWAPNVPVAARRLSPLGVGVVHAEGAIDNDAQVSHDQAHGRLPLREESFDVVLNRHESFRAEEVHRVLVGGGTFLTQQVTGDYGDIRRLLGADSAGRGDWSRDMATGQLTSAGLRVTDGGDGSGTTAFADVGALIWYLRAVPWAVPEFRVERFRGRLEELHATMPVRVREHFFWTRAQRSQTSTGA